MQVYTRYLALQDVDLLQDLLSATLRKMSFSQERQLIYNQHHVSQACIHYPFSFFFKPTYA